MTLGPDHCITCSDGAELGTVLTVSDRDATVELDGDGRREHVAVELVAPVAVGDRLLCHGGIALERVDVV
jgi:hydrogenase maturation factor